MKHFLIGFCTTYIGSSVTRWMDGLFFQFLATYNNEDLPNYIETGQNWVIFAKYYINLKRFPNNFKNVPKWPNFSKSGQTGW